MGKWFSNILPVGLPGYRLAWDDFFFALNWTL